VCAKPRWAWQRAPLNQLQGSPLTCQESFCGIASVRHQRRFFAQRDGARGLDVPHLHPFRRDGLVGAISCFMAKIVVEDVQRSVIGSLFHDPETVDGHVGHVARVAEIVSAVVMAAEHRTTLAAGQPVAVAEGHVPAPGAAVILPQIHEGIAVGFRILDEEAAVADGVQALPAQAAAAQSAVAHTHMGIEAGEAAILKGQVAAEIGADQSPVAVIVDIVGLRATGKANVARTDQADVIGAHGNRQVSAANGPVDQVAGQYAVMHKNLGAVRYADEPSVWRAVFLFACDQVGDAADLHMGTGDVDVAEMIVVFGFCLVGNGGELASGEGEQVIIDGMGADVGDLLKIKRQGRGEAAIFVQHEYIRAGMAVILVEPLADVVHVVLVLHNDVEIAAVGIIQMGLAVGHGSDLQRQRLPGGSHMENRSFDVLTAHIVNDELSPRPVCGGLHDGSQPLGGDVIGSARCGLYRKAETVGLQVRLDDGRHVVGKAVAHGTEHFIGNEVRHNTAS